MIDSKGYCAHDPKSDLVPFSFTRREPGPKDVLIDIHYCGICHSDLHQVKDEWGKSMYPMVPGHEIVGVVQKVGAEVTRYQVGDLVGVGCFVDSCRTCGSCEDDLEQYCENGYTLTYNSLDSDGKTPTYGGYSNNIVVDENFVLKVPTNLDLKACAPLLCAGITTYSPLRHWNVQKGSKVGVMGIGGLGHMAIKLAKAMGAEVTVFTHSKNKVEDAKRLGADRVVLSSQEGAFDALTNQLDLILNTISATIDLTPYLLTLKREATLVFLGLPDQPFDFHPGVLIFNRRNVAGSLIGGIKQTQEMLDFCSEHNITSDIELIPIETINEAYARMLKGDVKYRFVIDIQNSLS